MDAVTVEDILSKIDIVDLASRFTDLEEKGGEWWGLSPINSEKTPSFSVRRETGKFYDFSSGKGGSAITLLQLCCGMTSIEAIEELKKIAGIEGNLTIQKEKLEATKCCGLYAKRERREKESVAKVIPEDFMSSFEFNKEKLSIWEKEGIPYETMEAFGVRYDCFYDSIVYPVRNMGGQICNIGARTLDPEWKSKGLRKYTYRYPWGKMETIYGAIENMEWIIDEHQVILFEGCKSVLKAYSWGIKNCGALLTSHCSDAQAKILARLGCDVVFALDKEIDISKDRNIQRLKRYLNIFYLEDVENKLSDKDSPVDRGEEVFRDLLSKKRKLRESITPRLKPVVCKSPD